MTKETEACHRRDSHKDEGERRGRRSKDNDRYRKREHTRERRKHSSSSSPAVRIKRSKSKERSKSRERTRTRKRTKSRERPRSKECRKRTKSRDRTRSKERSKSKETNTYYRRDSYRDRRCGERRDKRSEHYDRSRKREYTAKRRKHSSSSSPAVRIKRSKSKECSKSRERSKSRECTTTKERSKASEKNKSKELTEPKKSPKSRERTDSRDYIKVNGTRTITSSFKRMWRTEWRPSWCPGYKDNRKSREWTASRIYAKSNERTKSRARTKSRESSKSRSRTGSKERSKSRTKSRSRTTSKERSNISANNKSKECEPQEPPKSQERTRSRERTKSINRTSSKERSKSKERTMSRDCSKYKENNSTKRLKESTEPKEDPKLQERARSREMTKSRERTISKERRKSRERIESRESLSFKGNRYNQSSYKQCPNWRSGCRSKWRDGYKERGRPAYLRERSRSRGRRKSKSRTRSKEGRERSKYRVNSKERNRSNERRMPARSKERDRSKEYHRSSNYDRHRERSRSKEREHSKTKHDSETVTNSFHKDRKILHHITTPASITKDSKPLDTHEENLISQPITNTEDAISIREEEKKVDLSIELSDIKLPSPSLQPENIEIPSKDKDSKKEKEESKPPPKILNKSTRYIKTTGNWGQVSFQKYQVLNKVGEGTYGKVYIAKNDAGDSFAFKEIQMDNQSEGVPITAIREIKILRHLHHANIIKLEDVLIYSERKANLHLQIPYVFLAMEFAENDLAGLIEASKKKLIRDLSSDQIASLFRQLLSGLKYCHSKKIMHRDLQPRNILINDKGRLKIANWKMACFYGQERSYSNRVISLPYRPPELLLGKEDYGPAVDMWSMGCILIEIFTNEVPFASKSETEQVIEIFQICGTPVQEEWPEVKNLPLFKFIYPLKMEDRKIRQKYEKTLPAPALNLIDKIFVLDPKKRITASAASKMEWLLYMPISMAQSLKFPAKQQIQSVTMSDLPKLQLSDSIEGMSIDNDVHEKQIHRYYRAFNKLIREPVPSILEEAKSVISTLSEGSCRVILQHLQLKCVTLASGQFKNAKERLVTTTAEMIGL